jgi:threonine dehydrogenase-like Zn-dependent dehydrogenase
MSGMMNALVWRGGPNLTLDQLPEPEPGPGQVAFDVGLAGICGSDLHPYRGHAGPRLPPLVLGHEAIGTSPGRQGRFVVFPLVGCRHCDACRRGEVNLCETRGLVGLDRQGVFAERVVVGEDALVPIPDGMDDRVAVLTEPLATPISALRLAGAGPESRVVVFGGGPIGLLTVHACTAAGIGAELVEPVAARRELATRMGASRVHESAADVPGGRFDLAVDAVGIEPTWQPAIASVRMGGAVTVVGLGAAQGAVSVGDLVRRGIALRGHYAYTRADFETALELLASDPPGLEWLRTMPLTDGAEGFRLLVDEPAENVKILLAAG